MENEILAVVLNKMDPGASVCDGQYDALYREGNAAEGVKAIQAAGKFFVNGFAMPTQPEEFSVNAEAWLKKEENGWRVDRNVFETFEDARFALVERIPAGVDVIVYDTDGDGYADEIRTLCPDSMIAAELNKDAEGNWLLNRGDVDPALPKSEKDGTPFFGPAMTYTVSPEHMDSTVKQGDIVLVTCQPDGWHVDRAIEIRGEFMGGEDHHFYIVSGRQYPDAMRFSRGNIIVSNRNGEFSNAQKYFGLCDDGARLPVSFWIAPTSLYPERTGAPIGFTCGENSGVFLNKAIAAAEAKLEAGSKAPEEAKAELRFAIDRAKAALSSPNRAPQLLDFQVYLLYLTLHGSLEDIGARFAGFRYEGFDRYLSE